MYVVLDANAVVSEGFGASALLRFLLSSSKIVGHHIFIPELVVEEVVAKFERTIVVEADEAQRAVDQLSKRLTTPLPSLVTALDQQKKAAFVRARLQEQFTDTISAILDYPHVSHRELVRRAVARQKPFDDKGSGYRDTLIWHSVLELAMRSTERIGLITRDRDFLDSDKKSLHPKLADELVASGYCRNRVTVIDSISTFVDVHVRPRLQKVLQDNSVWSLAQMGIAIEDVIAKQVYDTYSEASIDPDEVDLPWDCEALFLSAVDYVGDVIVVDVRELTTGQALLRGHAKVDCCFNVVAS